MLLDDGATHIGIATDHVIESFRNDLWPGYKTGEGIEPAIKAQFPLLEEVMAAAGFTVWPMVEVEADDAVWRSGRQGRGRGSRRYGRDLHARQGPGPVCGRRPGDRPVRSPQGGALRRGWRAREVRGRAGVDPRLPGPGRRHRRRVPRASGMGGQVGRRRVGPVRPHRGHPGGPRTVGHHGAGCTQARRHPPGPAGRGTALPPDRHTGARRAGVRRRRRAAMDRTDRGDR